MNREGDMNKRYQGELTALAKEQIMQIALYVREEFRAPETSKRLVDYLEKVGV